MEILFVSDYVCPYCLAAKEAMLQAIKELELTPDIIWQPFELTIEPKPQVDTYHDEVRKSHYQILVEPCRKLGLDMKLPPAVVPRPYTRLAFEGYFFAIEKGLGDAYNDKVYKAYFIDEKDIGDLQVLCDLAAETGLDRDEFCNALSAGTYTALVQDMNRHGREVLGVKHVPTIYIDSREINIEEYTKEEFIKILSQADAECRDPEAESCEADTGTSEGGCGPDGCSF